MEINQPPKKRKPCQSIYSWGRSQIELTCTIGSLKITVSSPGATKTSDLH